MVIASKFLVILTSAWQGLFPTILLHFLHPWRSEQEVRTQRPPWTAEGRATQDAVAETGEGTTPGMGEVELRLEQQSRTMHNSRDGVGRATQEAKAERVGESEARDRG